MCYYLSLVSKLFERSGRILYYTWRCNAIAVFLTLLVRVTKKFQKRLKKQNVFVTYVYR